MRLKIWAKYMFFATGTLLIFGVFYVSANSAISPLGNANVYDEQIKTIEQTPILTPSITVEDTPSANAAISESISEHSQVSKITTTPLNPQAANYTQTKTGSITTLTFNQISANTVYEINLSGLTYDSFVISWSKGSIVKWSDVLPSKNSELTELPIDEDELPQDTKYFTGLLPKLPTSTIYAMADSNTAQITISLLNPSDDIGESYGTQAIGTYNFDAGASYSTLPIVSRDSWGANPASWDTTSNVDIDAPTRLIWYPVYYKTARIIVHHTATAANTTTPSAAVRSIYLYHAYVRGWGDIGYNFLIDQNGTIYQGKLGGDEAMGYHAFGSANQSSLGISLIGDFTNTTPTNATRSSLIALMAEKAAFYGFTLRFSDGAFNKWTDQSYTVFGHRGSYKWDSGSSNWVINATACPGNAFYPQMPALVAEAETYRQNNFAEIKQVTSEVNAAFAAPHEQGVIRVQYAVPENTSAAVIASFLPKYSGFNASDYTISGNTVTISVKSSTVVHPAYGDSEYLVPPMGWTGYYNEFSTLSPSLVMNGPEDRAKTLLKIFKLDSRVESADVKNYYQTQ